MAGSSFFQKRGNLVFLALLCTFLWGCCFPLIKLNYEYFMIASSDIGSKILLAGLRFLLSGLIVLSVVLLRAKHQKPPFSIKTIRSILILCIFQTVLHYGFTYIGLANTTGAKGAVLKELSTFIIILAAPVFYRDSHFGKKELLGCGFGLLGIAVMNIGSDMNVSFGLLGEGFVLLAAVSVATAYLFSKLLLRDEDPVFITGCQQLLGGIILTLIGWTGNGAISAVSLKGVTALLLLSIASSVAYVVWMLLLKFNELSKVSIFGLGTPIFGTLTSGLFLRENIFIPKNMLALLLVCLGIVIINYHEKNSYRSISRMSDRV
ncbi:MAG: Permease of the drug/metabolite transporter superfamily [Paenibacillaceae bacterium]|jgi:drug/metabolite transporter (DMT)-like permease|nr:Permease of the drug/metabolite transporter superfamily [Paenibacillaceae bacterium]